MTIAASDVTTSPGIGSGVGKLTREVIGRPASDVERAEANSGDKALPRTGRRQEGGHLAAGVPGNALADGSPWVAGRIRRI
jgi:hypothetical protein